MAKGAFSMIASLTVEAQSDATETLRRCALMHQYALMCGYPLEPSLGSLH